MYSKFRYKITISKALCPPYASVSCLTAHTFCGQNKRGDSIETEQVGWICWVFFSLAARILVYYKMPSTTTTDPNDALWTRPIRSRAVFQEELFSVDSPSSF